MLEVRGACCREVSSLQNFSLESQSRWKKATHQVISRLRSNYTVDTNTTNTVEENNSTNSNNTALTAVKTALTSAAGEIQNTEEAPIDNQVG